MSKSGYPLRQRVRCGMASEQLMASDGRPNSPPRRRHEAGATPAAPFAGLGAAGWLHAMQAASGSHSMFLFNRLGLWAGQINQFACAGMTQNADRRDLYNSNAFRGATPTQLRLWPTIFRPATMGAGPMNQNIHLSTNEKSLNFVN